MRGRTHWGGVSEEKGCFDTCRVRETGGTYHRTLLANACAVINVYRFSQH